MAKSNVTQAAPAASVNQSSAAVLSPAVAHQCAPLGAIILDLGSRLGTLDQLSRKVMTELLRQLVEAPDDAPEIARLANTVAQVQQPMVRDAALHLALTRSDAREFVSRKGVQS